jgi:murein DD-endopeptidase MepM/ murein hydrolase activator NlpD
MDSNQPFPTNQSIDGLTLAAVVFIAFMAFILFREMRPQPILVEDIPRQQESDATDLELQVNEPDGSSQDPAPIAVDETLISAPYDNYTLTQGPHGYSYGHMAVDIAAGEGSPIKSPIDGHVTALYVDQYGNPTLVLENDIYQITMLHGKYTVAVDEEVRLGQRVGTESNLGYTTDYWGRSCRNRDCGYHTHLNIFDKRTGGNINPLDVIDP